MTKSLALGARTVDGTAFFPSLGGYSHLMNPPRDAMLTRLSVAAELRATGATWEAVGCRVRRSAHTCREWPQLYPEEWRRLYCEAETRLFADAGSEALRVLRRLLRSQKERTCLEAARYLLQLRQKMRALESQCAASPADAPDADALALVRFIQSLDAAQLDALLAELIERTCGASPLAPKPAGGPDPNPAGSLSGLES